MKIIRDRLHDRWSVSDVKTKPKHCNVIKNGIIYLYDDLYWNSRRRSSNVKALECKNTAFSFSSWINGWRIMPIQPNKKIRKIFNHKNMENIFSMQHLRTLLCFELIYISLPSKFIHPGLVFQPILQVN